MTKASTATTINAAEAAHFGALAADWWDPKGSSAMLHKLNPVRLGFIRDAIDAHFGGDGKSTVPAGGQERAGRRLRRGLAVRTACPAWARPSPASTPHQKISRPRKAHAALSGLSIDYRAGEIAAQGLATFDVVSSMEVIEHVTDPAAFIAELARHLKPDGLHAAIHPQPHGGVAPVSGRGGRTSGSSPARHA